MASIDAVETRKPFYKLIKPSFLILALAVVALLVFFNIQTDGVFLSQRNITLLLKQAAILSLVTSGMVMLIVARQIDLSAGAAVYLVSVVVAQLTVAYDVAYPIAVVAGVAVGLILGAFQGVMVSRLMIPAFIVTLAGSLIFKGLGYVWTGAVAVGPVPDKLIGLSEGFISPALSAVIILAITTGAIAYSIRSARKLALWVSPQTTLLKQIPLIFAIAAVALWATTGYKGLPLAVVIAGVIVTGCALVLSKTAFGRNVYAVGGNPDAAQYAGVRWSRVIFSSFTLMGLIYGVAGVLMTARLGGAAPSAGQLLELDAIAAAVIGGTSFAGGVGVIPGAILGALLLTAIDNSMSLMNVSSFLQMVVKGVILLAAVWFDLSVRKRKAGK